MVRAVTVDLVYAHHTNMETREDCDGADYDHCNRGHRDEVGVGHGDGLPSRPRRFRSVLALDVVPLRLRRGYPAGKTTNKLRYCRAETRSLLSLLSSFRHLILPHADAPREDARSSGLALLVGRSLRFLTTIIGTGSPIQHLSTSD